MYVCVTIKLMWYIFILYYITFCCHLNLFKNIYRQNIVIYIIFFIFFYPPGIHKYIQIYSISNLDNGFLVSQLILIPQATQPRLVFLKNYFIKDFLKTLWKKKKDWKNVAARCCSLLGLESVANALHGGHSKACTERPLASRAIPGWHRKRLLTHCSAF